LFGDEPALHAGNWSERLLQSMYYVTAQHGTVFPHEIERLWSTVAGNKRNIIPILDYVISKGQLECGQASVATISNS
jgi:hypothetical protein